MLPEGMRVFTFVLAMCLDASSRRCPMHRYVGLDVHLRSTTIAMIAANGKRIETLVVETHGQALVEAIRLIPGRLRPRAAAPVDCAVAEGSAAARTTAGARAHLKRDTLDRLWRLARSSRGR